jgi:hypothetical protein
MARNRALGVVLVLSAMLAAMPATAGAAQRQGSSPAARAWAWLPQIWRAAVERVVSAVPEGWAAKLGPGMDPDGAVAPPAPVDLGPGMDPNGVK